MELKLVTIFHAEMVSLERVEESAVIAISTFDSVSAESPVETAV